MKVWLRINDISYRSLASEMKQSASSVSKKVNHIVPWQSSDLAFFHDSYGLSSDFVLGFSSDPYGREVSH
jgi:hypothetical protein